MLSFYDLIEIKKPQFTENDTEIYNALKDYPGLIERFTVSQFADHLNMSTASIMRFAKKLGYSGYSELRFEYIKAAHDLQQNESIENESPLSQYVKHISESFLQFNEMDETLFTGLSEEIKKPRHIYAVGSGKSGLPAEYMHYSFIRLEKNIQPVTDSILINDLPKILSSDDLVIYFSEKAGNTATFLKAFIKNNEESANAKIIIVTCNPDSPFQGKVDQIIALPNVNRRQDGIRTHSLMLGFVDVLVAYYVKDF